MSEQANDERAMTTTTTMKKKKENNNNDALFHKNDHERENENEFTNSRKCFLIRSASGAHQ
jgi:hypothetical protein